MRLLPALALFLVMGSIVSAGQETVPIPGLQELQDMSARLAPTPIRVDTSTLSAGDQKALAKVIQASRLLNTIYLEQLWSGNLALYPKLQQDTSPLGRARLHYFWMMKSPWSALDHNRAFLPDVPPRKLPGSNFYPADMTKGEFESWVKTLSPADSNSATGFFTIITRDARRQLQIIPYSRAYAAELQQAARLLQQAAALTPNASLKKFLRLRADAFLSNDYRSSDEAWMELDAPLDITIGPYETYQDELFGYKGAFESVVTIRDEAAGAKLAFLGQHLQELENNLPEDPQYRNPKLGAGAPMRVVNEVFAAGDADHGIKLAAFNLPNDEVVVKEKGSKRVMLKNIQELKFKTTLLPISKVVLPAGEQRFVDFNAFFTHIVAHEVMHGLGPHEIQVQGRTTTARGELKELFSALEEAKADVTGLWALQYMLDHPDLERNPALHGLDEKSLYTTFLASAFRSIRFGISEAHGQGTAVQLNFLLDKAGLVARPDGTFAVNYPNIKDAIRDLDHDLLTLEATGDYAGARKMLDQLGVVRPEVQRVLDRLKQVPVDIDPRFVTADQIAPPAAAAATRKPE